MITRTFAIVAAGVCATAVALMVAAPTGAGEVDSRRGATLVVHAPRPARLTPRPRRVRWTTSLGSRLGGPPAVDREGHVVATTAQGDVVRLDRRDGRERWRAPLGMRPAACAALADGSVAAVAASGEVAVVREGLMARSFSLESGREHASIVALSDGGFAVAADRTLAIADASGTLRSLEALSDAPAAPLARVDGGLALVMRSGLVGVREARGPLRIVARLPGRPSAVSALSGARLGAIVDGRRAIVVDLRTGASLLDVEPQGVSLLTGPASDGARTRLLAHVPGRVLALAFDPSGREASRVGVTALPAATTSDGGAPPAPPALVTSSAASGPTAVALEDGSLAVVSEAEGVVTWTDSPCSGLTGRAASTIASLTVTDDGSLVVACAHGTVALLEASASAPAP